MIHETTNVHGQNPGRPTPPRRLVSIAEACELIGISRATGYEWARRGELPGLVTLGGRYHVVLAALESFLDGRDIERWECSRGRDGMP